MTNKQKAKLLRSAASALQHGRHTTANKKLAEAQICFVCKRSYSRCEARAAIIKRLRSDDQTLAMLDAALDAAEKEIANLIHYGQYDPFEVAEAFMQHASTHLADELLNIKMHGHRNDDQEDVPE